MRYISLIISILFIIFEIQVSGCTKKSGPDKVVQPRPLMNVTTAVVKYESVPNIIYTTGIIEPWQEAVISAEISGVDIVEVYANVGDQVKKGQILAQLSAAQIKADLLNAQANVADARAKLEKAKIELIQAKELKRFQAISSQELLQYSTIFKTTQAQLTIALANLKLQKLRLIYTKIIAPDDGVVSSRNAAVGNVVLIGNELFKIVRKNLFEWHAEVATEQLSQIKPGQQVKIKTEDGEFIDGVVRQVSPSLNNNSKDGLIYVSLKNNKNFKTGMNLSGEIYIGVLQRMVVPLKAIVFADGFSYILQISKNNQVHKVKVQLGQIFDELVDISGGLPAKALIVLDGGVFLNEGDFVAISRVAK